MLTVSLGTGVAMAQNQSFLRLKDGVERAYLWQPPKSTEFPTVVLFNGLVYQLERWAPFADTLHAAGYGVLRYSWRGQHWTLRKEIESTNGAPRFFSQGLKSADLAAEAKEILSALKVHTPVVIVGLSYGSSVASEFAEQFPSHTRALIHLAPMVRPLDQYDPQGIWLNQALDSLRWFWGPVIGNAMAESAFSIIYRSYYLNRIDSNRVPAELADYPSQYREAIFQLTRAVRNFDLRKKSNSSLPASSVTYLLANEDNNAVFADQLSAYERVPTRAKGPIIYFPEATHAIPDSQGILAASLVAQILQPESDFSPSKKYRVDHRGVVEVPRFERR